MVDALVRSAASPPTGRGPSRTLESVHDHWLHALVSREGTLGGAATAQRQLAEQVREWRRPISVSTATPFRLCFRLEEPEDEANGKAHAPKDPWYLRFLLQASDDPSLLVPVADAWAAKGRKAAVLKRGSFEAREYLLSALGQAVRVCPVIEESLKTSAPAGSDLDTVHAHAFLTQEAWMLEQAGFGVLLPAWWTRKGTKLRLSVRANVNSPKMQGGGLSLGQIITFDWQVALGDQTLTLQELETLAKLKAAVGQSARPMGAAHGRGDPGGPRLLEEEGNRPGKRARPGADGAGRSPSGVRRHRLWRCHGDRMDRRVLGATGRPARVRGAARHLKSSGGRCGPTRCAVIRGWRFSSAGVWARAWPTTWDWGRRSRRWR